MRSLHYKSKSFRLSDNVLAELEKRKEEFGSYNLLFESILFKEDYAKKRKPEQVKKGIGKLWVHRLQRVSDVTTVERVQESIQDEPGLQQV